MVLIPPFMMKPGFGESQYLPLRRVGTPIPLIVPDSGPEFLRAVFGQVVKQPLPVQAYHKAMLHNEKLMLCNGVEMPSYISKFHTAYPPYLPAGSLFFYQYNSFFPKCNFFVTVQTVGNFRIFPPYSPCINFQKLTRKPFDTGLKLCYS